MSAARAEATGKVMKMAARHSQTVVSVLILRSPESAFLTIYASGVCRLPQPAEFQEATAVATGNVIAGRPSCLSERQASRPASDHRTGRDPIAAGAFVQEY